MAMMPCSYVPTTRKEGAITNLKEKATYQGIMNTKHSWQTRATVKYIFFYFQNRLECFFYVIQHG